MTMFNENATDRDNDEDKAEEEEDEESVTVEVMPEYLRASHLAAGNSGRYPMNGAERTRCARGIAEELVAGDPEWTKIIEG